MAINIKSGTVGGDYENTPGWNLHKVQNVNEYRHFRIPVTFGATFLIAPTVVVALSALDCGSPTANAEVRNTRVSISAENITNRGFDLKITTWYDSHVFGVQASWLAYAL